jgi:hypothetical protein
VEVWEGWRIGLDAFVRVVWCGRGREPACGIALHAWFHGICSDRRIDRSSMAVLLHSSIYSLVYSLSFVLTIPSDSSIFHPGSTLSSQKSPKLDPLVGMVPAH